MVTLMLEEISKLCGDSADLVKRTINIGINKIDIIYSEALCSSSFIADFVLKPLSEIIIEENSSDNFYLLVKNSLTGSSCKELTDLNMAIEMLFLGSTIVIINNKEIISIETRAALDRGISSSSIEVAITGPKDSFTENFVKNLGLIRKRIRNNNLHVKALKLGSQSNTRVGICYMNNIVEKSLVESVFKRLEEINNDIIIDGGFITEELSKTTFFPQMNQTERPDLASFALLEGKVCLIIDNSPTVIIIPTFFIDFFHTPDDYYQKNINTTFIRILRFFAFFIAIFLPGYYISITTYNPTSIPTVLLLNLIEQHTNVPFPAFFEILIMILAFEILRESDIRIPNKVGSSVSILGGLILGDAAVSAGIISPIMIIVVAISSISALVFSYNSIVNLIRYYRYFVLFLSILFGIYGIFIGFAMLVINLSSISSFGYPYTYPFVPFVKQDINDSIIKVDSKKKKRNPLLARKNINR